MPNVQPLPVRHLRWVLEHTPVPTPARGALIRLDLPSEAANDGPASVEVLTDLRRVGDMEWVYQGPVRLRGDTANEDGDALMKRLHRDLGPRCVEVRVHGRSGDVADVTVFGQLRDR